MLRDGAAFIVQLIGPYHIPFLVGSGSVPTSVSLMQPMEPWRGKSETKQPAILNCYLSIGVLIFRLMLPPFLLLVSVPLPTLASYFPPL